MSTARDLAAHLRYLKDLGVDGVSCGPLMACSGEGAWEPDAAETPEEPEDACA